MNGNESYLLQYWNKILMIFIQIIFWWCNKLFCVLTMDDWWKVGDAFITEKIIFCETHLQSFDEIKVDWNPSPKVNPFCSYLLWASSFNYSLLDWNRLTKRSEQLWTAMNRFELNREFIQNKGTIPLNIVRHWN